MKGHSERRPARPFAAAHPGSHRGDWAAGAMRLELYILSSRPPRPPALAVTPRTVCTCQAGEFELSPVWPSSGCAGAGPKPQTPPSCPSTQGSGLGLGSSFGGRSLGSRGVGGATGPDRTSCILALNTRIVLPFCPHSLQSH